MKNPAQVIKDFIKKNGMTQRKFAALCKISRGTINLCFKNNTIKASTAQKIEDGTNKEIKFEDLTEGQRPDYYFTRVRVSKYRDKLKNFLQ